MERVVLNIPHASTMGIFDSEIGLWPRNPHFYNEAVREHTDWYTDMIFAPSPKFKGRVEAVVFPLSRFVCDVERLENDPLENKGQGILYTRYKGYERGDLSISAKETLLDKRNAHLARLEKMLRGIEDGIPCNSVLVDCHSFSSSIDEETDICIGFNNDTSYCKEMVDGVVRIFEEYGYKVSLNKPFSNSLTIPTMLVKSFMIEVNKRTYMNDKTLALNIDTPQRIRWYGCMDKVYSFLLDFEVKWKLW